MNKFLRNYFFHIILIFVSIPMIIGLILYAFSISEVIGLRLLLVAGLIFTLLGIFAFIDDQTGNKVQNWIQNNSKVGITKKN